MILEYNSVFQGHAKASLEQWSKMEMGSLAIFLLFLLVNYIYEFELVNCYVDFIATDFFYVCNFSWINCFLKKINHSIRFRLFR